MNVLHPGVVAFDEPGLLGQPVWFAVLTDGAACCHTVTIFTLDQGSLTLLATLPLGYVLSNATGRNVEQYAAPYDSGVVLATSPGGNATIILDRTQLAERVFRLTGGGLYRDSVLVRSNIIASVQPSQ